MKMCTVLTFGLAAAIGVGLATGAQAANYTWVGGTSGANNYLTTTNWNPNGVPQDGDSATINSAGAAVDLNTGGSAFEFSGGGTVTQNANTVSVTADKITLGTGTSVGNYTLNGGTLNLTITGNYNPWYIASDGSTFKQTGGTLNAQYKDNGGFMKVWFGGPAGSGTANYVMTGGTATYNNTNVVIFGQDGNAQLTLSGGDLAYHLYSTGGRVQVGANGNGTIDVSGGTLAVTYGTSDAQLQITDTGTVNLSGTGTISLDRDLAFTGTTANGTFNMTGGVLNAVDIENANGAGLFHFGGGTIHLLGDDTSILNQLWFVQDVAAKASYDSVNDVTTISAVPEPGTLALLAVGGACMLIRRRKAAA